MRGIKKCLSLLLSIFLVAVFSATTSAATLDDLTNQKNQISSDISSLQDAAENKEAEAKTLTRQISSIEQDIKSTESQLNETESKISQAQTKIEQLSKDLIQKDTELKEQKSKLNKAIIEIYRSSAKSDMQMLLGGSYLSQEDNESKYLEIIQIQVKSIFEKISQLKTSIEQQKSDEEKEKANLDELKNRQVGYKQSAEYQKNTKDKMLNMTVAQQEEYLAKVEKLKKDLSKVSAEIYAKRKAMVSGSGEVSTGGGSGYPYTASDAIDPWFFYTRQCTSYAAWYWNVAMGKSWTNTRPGSGSAYNWAALASDQGYSVSSTPRVGAIISWGKSSVMPYGHVAIVEAVNGNLIDVSEYNYVAPYTFGYRSNVNPGNYGSYSYIY